MANTAKNILTLNHEEAMDFFMKSEQYHGFELPEYFTFDEVQKYVRDKFETTPYEKLNNQYVSDYNQLWLHNMIYTQNKKRKKLTYSFRLCQLVVGKEILPLWNNDEIKAEFVQNMPIESIVDKETLKKVIPVITFRETRAYNEIVY